jgi:hypothetical protein
VCQLHETAVRYQLTAEGDDEGLAAKAVNIWRGGTKPVDEIGCVFQGSGLGSLSDWKDTEKARASQGPNTQIA